MPSKTHRQHIPSLRNLAKSRLGEKLAYIADHRGALQTFLTDGRVEINNNRVENLIRPIANGWSLCTPSLSVWKH